MLSTVILCVINKCLLFIMLIVDTLRVTQNVFMLGVIRLSVVAP
jgi:hypothetical protein